MSQKDRNKKRQPIPSFQKKTILKADSNKISSSVWIVLTIVIGATFAIYFKAIKFTILTNWDDQAYITNNHDISSLQWANIKLFFTDFYASNYQPITMLSYSLDNKIGAGNGSIFHFNNMLLHIINTFLVFVLIRKISPKNSVVALITAAFFAIHPMHVESVAWISERKDVLYTSFFLLSLIMYTVYLKKQKTKHLLLTAVFFVLSCLSKSAAVVLPLALLLFDYYSERKYSWKLMLEKIPFFLISLIFGIVAFYSQKSTGAIQNMAPSMSAIEHISIVSYSFISYLLKAFVPINLSAIYPYPVELGSTLPISYYLSILAVLSILLLFWYSLKWGKDFIFGFLFFMITIILTLQFIPVGRATMADRYSYVPYIGIFYIVGKIVERINSRSISGINYQKYSSIILAILFIAFSFATYARIKVWRNDETLFSDVIEKYPKCSVGYINRGVVYADNYAQKLYANDPENKNIYLKKAILDFEKCIQSTLIVKDRVKPYCDLGMAKVNLGDFSGAIIAFDNGINLDSTAAGADAYNFRAFSKLQLRNYAGAIEDYTKAIEINPKLATAYNNRGTAKVNLQDYSGAISDYDKAIEIESQLENAYVNRGIAKNSIKDYFSAIKDFNTAININSNSNEAYTNRGCSKFYLNNYQEALADYSKAIELNPQDGNAIKNRDVVMSILQNSKKK